MMDRNLSRIVLREVWRRLLQPAIEEAGFIYRQSILNLGTVDLRWDTVDVNFHWREDNGIERTIHCWLTGDWPRYDLRFEGAVWRDEEGSNGNHGKRTFKFLYPDSEEYLGQLDLSGSNQNPVVRFSPNEGHLVDSIFRLLKMIRTTPIDVDSQVIDLPGVPSRQAHYPPADF